MDGASVHPPHKATEWHSKTSETRRAQISSLFSGRPPSLKLRKGKTVFGLPRESRLWREKWGGYRFRASYRHNYWYNFVSGNRTLWQRYINHTRKNKKICS